MIFDIIIQLALLAAGFLLLIKGADFFVDGAAGIAEKMNIPQLVIGLTIVAMGTSAPETAVSISAAIKGSADITIGNIVGSNILNILIVLGLSAIITPLAVAKSTARIEIPFVIAVTALLIFQGRDGVVTFVEGVILWVAFLIYLAYLFVLTRKQKDSPENPAELSSKEEIRSESKKEKRVWMLLLLIVGGLACIIAGSDMAVDAATAIARVFGLSERFIGLTIVALGTSLPELVTSVSAARKGNADIAIGNIVGSNIMNILFVVGTSALIIPITFAPDFIIDAWVAVAAAVMLLICCLPKQRLGRISGILMLAGYVAYFAFICL